MIAAPTRGWTERLQLRPGVRALAAGLFVYGFGEELWFRYLPVYLRTLGASALLVGAFGTWKDLLDAGYAFPGGVLADRLASRRALLLFGLLTTGGFALYLAYPTVPVIFAGLALVMAWQSLGLPATFALVAEELSGAGRLVGFTVQAVVKRLPILLAPPLGGWLIGRLGMAHGMRVGFAVSVLMSLLMLAGLRRSWRSSRVAAAAAPASGAATASAPGAASAPGPASASARGPAAMKPARESGKLRLHPALRQLLVADCLIRLCEGLPEVFLVVWALEVARVSPARKALIVDLADREPGRTIGLYYSIRGVAVAGASAIGGALWTVRPALTFLAAAALGVAGTLWAALSLPGHPPAKAAPPAGAVPATIISDQEAAK